MDSKKSQYTVMSGSVSQIKYWRDGGTSNSNENNTEEGGEGAVYLSYNVFLGLSVLGGMLALDHLYLRSPMTFVAKIIINLLFFGVWWLYDAVHALFSTDIIKVFGLGVPGLGPRGIAGGVLANDVPDKKHLRFLMYAASLIFGGMIGLDSFVMGDNRIGVYRLVCFISVILAPIAMIWWFYKMFSFFTDTSGVIQENHEFFGAPKISMESRVTSKYPFLAFLFSPIEFFTNIFERMFGPIITPLQQTFTTVSGDIKQTAELARNTVAKGSELVGQIGDTIQKTSNAFSAASGVIPGQSLYASITPETLKQEVQKQSGGSESDSNLNLLPYTLLGTLAIIVVSGFVSTYYRSKKQNVASPDDTPPEPGVLRKPDSKERSS